MHTRMILQCTLHYSLEDVDLVGDDEELLVGEEGPDALKQRHLGWCALGWWVKR